MARGLLGEKNWFNRSSNVGSPKRKVYIGKWMYPPIKQVWFTSFAKKLKINKKNTAWSVLFLVLWSVYMHHCQMQYNRSISLHVQKLIYVNIYPQKCSYSVASLKTCSWADEKTIHSILSLYFKGVSCGHIVWTPKRARLGFYTFGLEQRISYLVTKYENKARYFDLNVIS